MREHILEMKNQHFTNVNHLLGSTIQIEFKKGLIRLPRNPETPLICIGPGTGVAPMRSVIEDRLHGGSNCKLFYSIFVSIQANYLSYYS